MSADEFLCLYEAGRREERQTYLLKSAAASDDQNAVAAAAADAVLLSRSAPAAFTAFPSDQGEDEARNKCTMRGRFEASERFGFG